MAFCATVCPNALVGVLTLAAGAMCLHYGTMMSTLVNCPVPFLFGEPGTGKTTALRCALGMTGSLPHRLLSRATVASVLSICSGSSVPIGLDDPSNKSIVEEIVVNMYNGASSTSVCRGQKTPKAGVMVSANFHLLNERYASNTTVT